MKKIELPICANCKFFLGHHLRCKKCSPGRRVSFIDAVAEVVTTMDILTDDQRVEVMNHYCRHCGGKADACQCWNVYD